MSSITAFLFIIGLLVFVHELGHFLVAKWCGVKVEKFSLGFGPTLLSFTRGETEYKICVLPFGGYVKMSGEENEGHIIVESARKGAKTPFEKGDRIISIEGIDITPESRWKEIIGSLRGLEGSRKVVVEKQNSEVVLKAGYAELEPLEAYLESEYPRSYSQKSVLRRLSIVTAGPLMNFILPFVLLPVAFMTGVYVPSYTESEPLVRWVESGAEKSAIRKGDRIVSVNGTKVKKWIEVSSALKTAGETVEIEVERPGGRVLIESSRKNLMPALIAEERAAVIGSVAVGSPAYRAGIKPEDRIVSIGNEKISGWDDMARIITQSEGRQLALELEREGKTVATSVIPVLAPDTQRAFIGITMKREETFKKFGFFESIAMGFKRAVLMLVEIVSLFFGFLFSLIGGEISLGQAGKTVAGPLFIAKMSGAMAQKGLASLLIFASFISVNLGLVNLLPIPVLDGGHVVYLSIEAARKKPLSRATLEITQKIGFSLLITIMLIATYNDVSNLWGEITGWVKNLGGLSG